MDLKLKGAVVGCGRMGAFTSDSVIKFSPRCWFPLNHAEAIRLHPGLELAALCDPDPVALARAAEMHKVSRTYSNYRDLIAKERPDLISIATRTPGRAAIIRFAAESGVRAMHIEKPLCNSMHELAALATTFADHGLYCTYGTIRRFFKVYQAARDLAHSGSYGDLREIRVNMGAGMLYWTHPHSVDLILYCAGSRRVDSVQARMANVVTGESTLQIVSDPIVESASIYFTDGVAGHVTRASGFSVVLSCADAEIAVENDGQCISISAPRGQDPYFHRGLHEGSYDAPPREGTYAPVVHLVNCLKGDEQERAANAGLKTQILAGQRILFAMMQSHAEKSRLVRERDIDPGITILARSGEKFA